MSFTTEQENFWAGEFGDEYNIRNSNEDLISYRCAAFSKILSRTRNVNSLIEFGPNIGANLRAIKILKKDIELSAVEINSAAVNTLKEWGQVNEIFNESILDFKPNKKWDLVLISGVLIHINPSFLNKAYEVLFESSAKYLVIKEYYNPIPVEIEYRGHQNKLFKRDFAGEILDKYDNVFLNDYGFIYHRDENFPADDGTWFLLEKNNL